MPKTSPDDTPTDDTAPERNAPGEAAPAETPPAETAIPPAPIPPAPVPPAPYTPVPPQATPPPAQYLVAAPTPYQLGAQQKPPTVLSLLAMIFGIVGVAISCCYGAGFLFSVAGIVLGHLGLKRESARGMALAGVITGYVGVAGAIIFWIVLMAIAFSPLLLLPFLSNYRS